MAFNQYQICQLFPVQWAHNPVETGCIAQLVHLFSMNSSGFSSICLVFWSEGVANSIFYGKSHCSMDAMSFDQEIIFFISTIISVTSHH